LNVSKAKKAVEILFENLKKKKIPLPLISQFMPIQYQKIRDGIIKDVPKELVRDNIVNVLDNYYSSI